MYLKSIKISGFKTFVEPTKVVMAQGINGIVGPNGCGKSNVVDALRWVVGESSAKQLRSTSMSDVIFNGSAQRKPLAKASVELLFDHQDKCLLGEYAAFSEIAIRREVNRDGDSNYSINGTSCRRKDIIDLLLGTGLGPRSYAIIEQGMIARFIEAKPEQLRESFEEVSGIAKYRVKRRETQNRMRHTQENIERVADVCLELDKQLRSLKRQANAAAQYKELKAEERDTQSWVYASHVESHTKTLAAIHADELQQQTAFSALQAESAAASAALEEQRLLHDGATEQHAEIQKTYYEHDTAIARLEQQIKSAKDNQERMAAEQSASQDELLEVGEKLNKYKLQHEHLTTEIAEHTPESERLQEQLSACAERAQAIKNELSDCLDDAEQFQAEASSAQRQHEVLKTQCAHAVEQQQEQAHNAEQWSLELRQLQQHDLQQEYAEQKNLLEQAEAKVKQAQDEICGQKQVVNAAREQVQLSKQAVPSVRRELGLIKSELDSISALQAQALRQQGAKFADWLAANELSSAPCLADELQVEAEWALAVEMVLGDSFQNKVVADVSAYISEQLPDGCSLLSLPAATPSGELCANNTLAEKVVGAWSGLPLLRGVYVANDLVAARTILANCAVHESVILPNGLWLGPGWVRTPVSKQAEDSVLLRQQRLSALEQEHAGKKSELVAAEDLVHEHEHGLELAQSALYELQQSAAKTQSVLAQAKTAVATIEAKQSAHVKQVQRAESGLSNARKSQQRWQSELQDKQEQLVTVADEVEAAVTKSEQWNRRRLEIEGRLEDAQEQKQEAQQDFARHQALQQAKQDQLSMLSENKAQLGQQFARLTNRCAELKEKIQSAVAPLQSDEEAIAEHLVQRESLEDNLRNASSKLQDLRQQVEQTERQHKKAEKEADAISEILTNLKVRAESENVRKDSLLEQLHAMDVQYENVLATVPADTEVAVLEQQLEKLQKRITRLGPINLAAISEYEEVSARRTHLSTQHDDLSEALRLLEAAIAKIDNETKAQFKHTFDQVNANFQELFPKVFIGGKASLALTEADWLTAGVVVRAQPPGKRNTTIHTLSGGEKALTAIALVFSLFRLSPAPFCVLDEVDAPLDDANVGRFCKLVESMANDVQFIVVSHNKVTIEAAQRLLGITMSEPGVSRVVSVNMQEAVSMVD